MKKTIASLALLLMMLTSLNATEAPTNKSDKNCTVEKCDMKKANDANCTLEKCKTMSKKDCMAQKKKCSRDGNQTSNHKMPKWSAAQDGNSSMKMSACCKNKKKAETKEEKPMKCGQGKCGGGKCGGK